MGGTVFFFRKIDFSYDYNIKHLLGIPPLVKSSTHIEKSP